MDACLLWLPYPLMLVNRALCGFLGIQSATIRQAAVQRYIPDRLRARLNAYESLLRTAAGAVLSLAIGALGEVLDYRLCMTICGLTTMLVCWLTVFLRRRQVQQVLSARPMRLKAVKRNSDLFLCTFFALSAPLTKPQNCPRGGQMGSADWKTSFFSVFWAAADAVNVFAASEMGNRKTRPSAV